MRESNPSRTLDHMLFFTKVMGTVEVACPRGRKIGSILYWGLEAGRGRFFARQRFFYAGQGDPLAWAMRSREAAPDQALTPYFPVTVVLLVLTSTNHRETSH